jgi:transposase InsO family protein
MPGKRITNQQVKLYMKTRSKGCTQATSSAKAGISVSVGRRIEAGEKKSSNKPRQWRTKKDPFFEVWGTEIVPLLEQSPTLTPLTLLEELQDKHPSEYPDSLLRTLQRRVKEWKSLNGKAKELIFLQTHTPGRLGLSDFTKLKGVTITIQGEVLKHLLYHFRLIYSGWSYLKVILGGESYTALSEGLQEALWGLGGSPLEHRTDSLSAAFKNTSPSAQKDLTQRYEEFCRHYQMEPTRNNRGRSHENGGIESPHGHVKRRIEQALLIRQSHDFSSVDHYQEWLDEVVKKHNRRNAKNVILERPTLQPLPSFKTTSFTEFVVRVHSTGTIEVSRTTYTVPSNFVGERLRVHLYDTYLACYLGAKLVLKLPRVYGILKKNRARLINYRHLVESLMKKPQAFRFSRLRDDILPTLIYKKIWDFLEAKVKGRESCKLIVGLLSIAAKFDCEKLLGEVVLAQIEKNQRPNLEKLREKFSKGESLKPPEIQIEQHSLSSYDELLKTSEVNHA